MFAGSTGSSRSGDEWREQELDEPELEFDETDLELAAQDGG